MFGGYLGTAINIAQGFLLVPLFIGYIGTEEYGFWLASGGIIGVLTVLNFGFSNIFIQRIASSYGRGDFLNIAKYFSNGIAVYLIVALTFIIIGLLISNFLDSFIAIRELDKFSSCFQLAVFAAGISIVNECLRGFAQSILRPIFSICYVIFFRVFGIIVTVYLLFHGFGLWSIPVGMFIAELLILICGVLQSYYFFRTLYLKFKLDKVIILEYLKKSSAISLATLGAALSRESDPILITYLLGPEMTVIFMVARKVSDIVSQSLSAFYGATYSSFSHLVGEGDYKKIKSVALRISLLVSLLGFIGFFNFIVMSNSFVSLWIGKKYILDAYTLMAIGVGCFTLNLKNLLAQLLNSFGLFKYTSYVILFDGIAKIILGYILINWLGLLGMPLALTIVGIASVIILLMQLKTKIDLELKTTKFMRVFLVALMFLSIAGYLSSQVDVNAWNSFFTSALLVFIFSISFVFTFFNKDINFIRIFLKNYVDSRIL